MGTNLAQLVQARRRRREEVIREIAETPAVGVRGEEQPEGDEDEAEGRAGGPAGDVG